jgi:7-carboxy-7-deazaguanine synthase
MTPPLKTIEIRMFGKNPKRPPEKGDGSLLQIQEIFYTFQGEGIYAGWPAVFVRLGGCNLACDFCDTEFESFQAMGVEEIVGKVRAAFPQAASTASEDPATSAGYTVPRACRGVSASSTPPLIILTGGEPFRQPISPLCDALLALGYHIQIETNGTLYRPLDPRVNIICSPKAPYPTLRPDLAARVNALKFIISATHPDYQTVPEVGQTEYNLPVYLQPMDEYDPQKNKENLDYTTRLVLEQGYRLSLQLHKIAGVP